MNDIIAPAIRRPDCVFRSLDKFAHRDNPVSNFGNNIVFRSSPTVGTIDLESSRTVNSLSFEAGYTLENHSLTVTTGNVDISLSADTTAWRSDVEYQSYRASLKFRF